MSSSGEAKKSASEQSTDLAPDNWKEIADMLSPDDVARLTVTSSGMHQVLREECIKQFLEHGCSKNYDPPKRCANIQSECVCYRGWADHGGDATITSVVVKEGVREINSEAFRRCYKLRSVRLPSTLKTIRFGAFRECTILESLILPEGLISIRSYAFAMCHHLKSVTLPESLEILGASAFEFCDWLETVELPKSLETIQPRTFANCRNLQTVILPEQVQEIGEDAFSGCDELAQVHVPLGCRVHRSAFPKKTEVVYTQPSLRAGYRAVAFLQALGASPAH